MVRKYSAPFYVDISITDCCNLNCLYCYANSNSSHNKHMNVGLFKKIVSELENLGTNYIRIAGGEPFTHPHIEEILKICKEVKMLKSISTNATLLDEAKVRLIADNSIDWVVVSLDGADGLTNDFTRGKYNEVIRGIDLLKGMGVVTRIACVVSKKNFDKLDLIMEFAEKKEISSVGFIIPSEVGRAKRDNCSYMPSKYELEQFLNNVYGQLKQKYNAKINIVFPYESENPWEILQLIPEEKRIGLQSSERKISQGDRISCNAGITTCAISSTGDLFGCEQFIGFPELAVGNLNCNSFQILWENFGKLEELRYCDKRNLSKECQECDHYCGGGCRAIAYGQTGNLFGRDERCKAIEIV